MNKAIEWFVHNPVAANLLLLLVVIAGCSTVPTIEKEVFPALEPGLVTVTVVYPGAAPEEVEEGICVRVEEALQGLDGVKRVTSTATEGVGAISVEVLQEADTREVLDDVKSRVDAIDTFPDDAEEPIVQEVVVVNQVVNVAVAGDADELTLKAIAEQVRDEIAALEDITQVEIAVSRPYEISVEVSERALEQHGLTFDHVVAAIRRSSLDLPGGTLRTRGGEILLRTKGQAYVGRDFEEVPVVTLPDGSRLTVGDVATVVDGLADTDLWARFNGQPAVMVKVYRIGKQSAIDVSLAVHEYLADVAPRLPDGIVAQAWQDEAGILRSRLRLLLRNGIAGLALVFIVLTLFLRFQLAFWVSMGLPMSFLGTLWVMPAVDVSVNLISLFAFIVVLGIVVDDAIVVAESIHARREAGVGGLRGAIEGTHAVGIPVTFGVLTTVAAFVPMLAVPGTIGEIMRVIPIIVIATLAFSLVESKLVLPSHLSHLKASGSEPPRRGLVGAWRSVQGSCSRALGWVADAFYAPLLAISLRFRYLTVAVAVSTLLLTVGLVVAGWVRFAFFPPVEADNAVATVSMPLGTPVEVTAAAVQQLEDAALQLREEFGVAEWGEPIVRRIITTIGDQPFRQLQTRGHGPGQSYEGAHRGEVNLELVPAEYRDVTSEQAARRWRELTGVIPDALELSFSSTLFETGADVHVRLQASRLDVLRSASDELQAALRDVTGVRDVTDSFREGKREVKLRIRPEAEAHGLALSDLARQVRQAFHGEEAQRVQRGRDDVKVMVRYPRSDRRSLGDLETLRVRKPDGTYVPFGLVAEAWHGRGYSAINRADRHRSVDVKADVDEAVVTAGQVLERLETDVLPKLMQRHAGLAYTLEGQQREQAETMGGLWRGFALLALPLIYALLAIPLRSYLQPIMVMAVIPFGMVGAVWGHLIMNMDLSILSTFGIVALSGVVVNDSLVLVDFVNRNRAEGRPLVEAVRIAGRVRFRPIILTSLTTFAGLTPLLLERSVQAKFLVPMAVSLGFGIVFATFISLVLVPCSYLILEDLRRAASWLAGWPTGGMGGVPSGRESTT